LFADKLRKNWKFFKLQTKNLKLQKDGILSGGRAPPASKNLLEAVFGVGMCRIGNILCYTILTARYCFLLIFGTLSYSIFIYLCILNH
jgi:hypothetical protein